MAGEQRPGGDAGLADHIGQDMDVTYQQTGEQGIQWCSWMDWVKWVKNANKDARFVGKVTT